MNRGSVTCRLCGFGQMSCPLCASVSPTKMRGITIDSEDSEGEGLPQKFQCSSWKGL